MRRLRQSVLVLLSGASLIASLQSRAIAACRSTCTEELRSCRRTCDVLHASERRRCAEACRTHSTCTAHGASFRTGAYVVSHCQADPNGHSSFGQRLLVRRGNCDPITIYEIPENSVQDPLGVCRLFGELRFGFAAMEAGAFQRIGVLVDGSGVVFEMTSAFSLFPSVAPVPPEPGIFFAHADGTGLHRLGDAGRAPAFSGTAIDEPVFAISDDGKTVAFSDLGPGVDGVDARQIFTIDLPSGRRQQLTQLTAKSPPGAHPVTCCPSFLDNHTIVFTTMPDPSTGQGSYSISTDGSDLQALSSIVPIPGATVLPRFDVTSGGTHVTNVTLPGKSLGHSPLDPEHVREVFLFDHDNVLQLTSLHHYDTNLPLLLGRRVFFISSADPFGINTGEYCQIFSIDALGGQLRQLTHLQDSRPAVGCLVLPGGSCRVTSGIRVDPVTGIVVFGSSCDPFGTNPFGDQFFVMRADGSGLRQITATRGLEVDPDGTVRVELPGPANYSAPVP